MKPGDEVLVRALKRRGEIVEVLQPGTYKVLVGGLATIVRDADIDAVPATRGKRRTARVPPPEAAPVVQPSRETRALAKIDLHGLTVDEARNRVVGHISRAILAGLDRVEIVHGIGSGRLKAAITADLRRMPAIRAVRPHPSNPGVTIVDF